MAKRLSGSGCRLGGESGRSRMGVLNGGGDRQRGKTVLGVNLGHPSVTNVDFVT